MKKINENILAISEPDEPYQESPERENIDSKSLDERVATLIPNVLARNLDANEKTGPAASEGLAVVVY